MILNEWVYEDYEGTNSTKRYCTVQGANYPVEDEINPEDVVEIFNTPLTGSYNWDYTVQDNRIKKLYELGKEHITGM